MLQLDPDTTGLRPRLVIENQSIGDHCGIVAALQVGFHHTIRCIDQAAEGTCVIYALGLRDQFPCLCAELEFPGTKQVAKFVKWLLDEERLTETDDAPQGALVLYFDGETWTHAGVALGMQRIRSKWGNYAVFDHALREVPADYGNVVGFYSMPDIAHAAELLFQFVRLELGANHPIEIERLRKITCVPDPDSA